MNFEEYECIRFGREGRVLTIALNRPEHFDADIAYECLSNRSADHGEAVRAFAERRKPQFTGN